MVLAGGPFNSGRCYKVITTIMPDHIFDSMKTKAIILDLDNTIYPVSSIGEELFSSLFQLIQQYGEYSGHFPEIKQAIMRQPFQKVADTYKFSNRLKEAGTDLLKNLTYDKPMLAFADYAQVKHLPGAKFLVTTGFAKLQQSKIKQLNLASDFTEIQVVDPSTTSKTKQDVFQDILSRHNYQPAEVVVVGDDPESELKGGAALGLVTVLYDKINLNPGTTAYPRITDFSQLKHYIT